MRISDASRKILGLPADPSVVRLRPLR